MKFLYVIQSELGSFKVGITGNMKARFRTIKTSAMCEVEIFNVWEMKDRDSAIFSEKKVHEELAKYRLCGEWFRLNFDSAMDLHLSISARMAEGHIVRSVYKNKFIYNRNKRIENRENAKYRIKLRKKMDKEKLRSGIDENEKR